MSINQELYNKGLKTPVVRTMTIADHLASLDINEITKKVNATPMAHKEISFMRSIMSGLFMGYLADGILLGKYDGGPIPCGFCDTLVKSGDHIRLSDCEHKSHATCYVKNSVDDKCQVDGCHGVYASFASLR